MFFTVIIRLSEVRPTLPINISWDIFWQQMEASLAVLVVSLTAFRALFVEGSGSRGNKKRIAASPRYDQGGETLKGRGSWWRTPPKMTPTSTRVVDDGRGRRLPNVSIPSATMTGIRTIIRDGPTASSPIEDLRTIEGDVVENEWVQNPERSWYHHGKGGRSHPSLSTIQSTPESVSCFPSP
ncbi:hypothetical protein MMC14_005211 [Varicellaria rhodocarpa]|nr:hypothetical protein [Varicellaria rhodocarpa]